MKNSEKIYLLCFIFYDSDQKRKKKGKNSTQQALSLVTPTKENHSLKINLFPDSILPYTHHYYQREV